MTFILGKPEYSLFMWPSLVLYLASRNVKIRKLSDWDNKCMANNIVPLYKFRFFDNRLDFCDPLLFHTLLATPGIRPLENHNAYCILYCLFPWSSIGHFPTQKCITKLQRGPIRRRTLLPPYVCSTPRNIYWQAISSKQPGGHAKGWLRLSSSPMPKPICKLDSSVYSFEKQACRKGVNRLKSAFFGRIIFCNPIIF